MSSCPSQQVLRNIPRIEFISLRQNIFNRPREFRIRNSQNRFMFIMCLWKIEFQKVFQRIVCLAYKSATLLKFGGSGVGEGPSEMSFAFSRACAAFLKGVKETSLTRREKV